MTHTNNEGLLPLVEQFTHAHILVIGDVMLDKFIWGDVTRVSPEAPVPVVHVKNETCAPGGAANAAMNVAAMGATCTIVGLVGEDSASDVLRTLLTAKNIVTDGLFTHQKPTIQKIRVMGNNHQLLRYDYEEKSANEKEKEMLAYIKQIIDPIDVILVSDYAKGTITQSLMNDLKTFGKKIIVDPKADRFHFYNGVYLIKPNDKEAREITGITHTTEETINAIGAQLIEQSKAHILISRGKEGMSLFELNGSVSHLPTRAHDVHDVTGAGDTVVATAAVAIAIDATLNEAATLANHAAGIKVSKLGTVPVSRAELHNTLRQSTSKLKNREELIDIARDFRNQHKKIIFTNGCFDILHIGHTRLLQQAKALGDILILALDTDASVACLKGSSRPVISQQERAEILSALDCVDYILFFESTELPSLLTDLKPDYLVKGGDYSKAMIVGGDIVEQYGGSVVIIPTIPGKSTTSIIELMKQSSSPQ